MPRPKKDSNPITEASPHTIKKFELIERYADEWARKILGFQGKNGLPGSKGVVYIDCMSNSGVYRDKKNGGTIVDGTALRVAKRLNTIITEYPGKKAILIFNDILPERTEKLREEINNAKLDNIEVSYSSRDCNLFLKSLDLSAYRQQFNTLLIYDPYNASIDWDAVSPFLNTWGEVIINHMVSDTTRGVTQAKKANVIERYQETYQNDIATILSIGSNKEELNKVVISIINKRMSQTHQNQYIASFPFFNRTNGLVYNLIFCSANIKGIILFKKVAWKTFGDKSSLKDTHGSEQQMSLLSDFPGLEVSTVTDDECYFVIDIAKDIYKKYCSWGAVELDEIYHYLDEHPIFPSDGYKLGIKTELKALGVTFQKDGKVVFPSK